MKLGTSEYRRVHYQVERERGKPKRCEHCKVSGKNIRFEWANLSGNYDDPYDYIRLCKPCHSKMDAIGTHNNHAKGERHGSSKLTKGDVEKIRSLKGEKTQKEIGEMFGVTQMMVSKIHRNLNWRL